MSPAPTLILVALVAACRGSATEHSRPEAAPARAADAAPAIDAPPADTPPADAPADAPKLGAHHEMCGRAARAFLACEHGLECCPVPSGVQVALDNRRWECLTHAECMVTPP